MSYMSTVALGDTLRNLDSSLALPKSLYHREEVAKDHLSWLQGACMETSSKVTSFAVQIPMVQPQL